MIDPSLILNINQSWLNFLTEALKDEDIDLIYQTSDILTADGQKIEISKDFVIASPVNQWRHSGEELEAIEANFRIGVVTTQQPGQILIGNMRNLEIQAAIQQALYGSERLLEGGSMGERVYSIPLWSYGQNGDPDELLDSFGIKYGENDWNDRTPDGSRPQFWVIEIPVIVNR